MPGPSAPIADLGRDRRLEIDRRLGLHGDETLVLMGLGGVNLRPPLEAWPALAGVCWLIPPDWGQVDRPDVRNWTVLTDDCSMVDLIRSCDVLFTKSGYGAFAEAACNATRVLYVGRDDWPEEPWLSRWLTEHGNALKIDRRQLAAGDWLNLCGRCWRNRQTAGGAVRHDRGRRLAGASASMNSVPDKPGGWRACWPPRPRSVCSPRSE